MVTLHTTYGPIKVELFSDKAPETVENFLQYCSDGHYDGTLFHRVIDGFMIQGGGYLPGFKEKSTRSPVKNEANNGISNARGTLAMARTNDPHSATAQFFINVNDNNFLDFKGENAQSWGYCVFGQVTEGMDVVEKIKSVATGNFGFVHQDVPVDDVLIERIEIE